MIRKKLWLGLGLMVILAMMIASCGGTQPVAEEPAAEEPAAEEPAAEEPAAEEAQEPIIIGYANHQTGWMSAYDKQNRQGALLAVDYLNDTGGILGRPVEVIELDGQTDPEVLRNVTEKLVQEGADLILVPCDFDMGAAANMVAQEHGLVGISPASSSPLHNSTVLGDLQFTLSMFNNTMGAAGAEFAINQGWTKAYALTDVSYDYGPSLRDPFIEAFEYHGGEVLLSDTYLAGDADIKAQISRYQELETEPDVMLLVGSMPDLGMAIRQIRGAGIDIPIISGDSADTDELWEAIGPEAGDDIYVVTHTWVKDDSANPKMGQFIELFTEKYGQPPDLAMQAMGWDAVMVLAQASEYAGTIEGAAVADAMEELEFDLLSGKLDWTDAEDGHQPQKEATIIVAQDAVTQFVTKIKPSYLPSP
jgi:branched-chain amino acid transport system substrate-binding protein